MDHIRDLLETARFHIDGQMNCNSPEYHAMDHLERAISELVDKVESATATASQAAKEAA